MGIIKTKALVIVAVCMLLNACGAAPQLHDRASYPSEDIHEIDLFIWAGQSNAQGWQGDADYYPPDPDSLDSRIRLNYTFIGSTRSNGWVEMQPQEGRFASGHFGPEVTFSRKLKEAGYNPAIFKYSRGSTSIHSDWLTPGEAGYYDEMVADLDTAVTGLESQGHTVNIRGFVWIQGESDGETHVLAGAYETSLLSIISDFRNNVVGNSALPIILGVDEQHYLIVDQPAVLDAHKSIARNDDHIKFTSMYGLPKADDTHLTPAGLMTHGEQIFEALEPLLKK
jgi:hypothetical protein